MDSMKNNWSKLPVSLVGYIFELDPTYRDVYSRVVMQQFHYVDVGHFRVNESTGHHQLWHENGGLWDFTIRDGRYEGKERVYTREGLMYMEKNYKNGQLDGWFREFYDNGNPKSEKWFVKGNEEGVVTYWFPEGTLFQKCFYRNGLKHGPFLQFGIFGGLKSVREYRNGKVVKQHM